MNKKNIKSSRIIELYKILVTWIKKTYTNSKNIIIKIDNSEKFVFKYFWIYAAIIFNLFFLNKLENHYLEVPYGICEQYRWEADIVEQVESPDLMEHNDYQQFNWEDKIMWYEVSWLISSIFLIPYIASIFLGRKKESPVQIFYNVCHSYVGIAFMFSFLYYAITIHSDFKFSAINNSVGNYSAFEMLKGCYKADFNEANKHYEPTIIGIKSNLFYEVGELYKLKFYEKYDKILNADYFESVEDKIAFEVDTNNVVFNKIAKLVNNCCDESFVKINLEKTNEVYVDCFLFSCKSLANLEIGQYSPNNSIIKFLSAIEAMIGVILTVFALGLIIQGISLKSE